MKAKILITFSILAILYTGYRVWQSPLLAGMHEQRVGKRVMNVKTGYKYYLQLGRDFKGWPVKCPDTGTMDCYPAEACYWNQCGDVEGGTWVVLNDWLGKEGPTTCPVCNHEVVGRNPLPPGTYLDLEGKLHRSGEAQGKP